MAVSRRPEKGLEWPPNGLERGARRGRNPCPGAAAAMASLRSISLRLHFVAWRRAAGATSDLYRFFGHAGWRDCVAAMP